MIPYYIWFVNKTFWCFRRWSSYTVDQEESLLHWSLELNWAVYYSASAWLCYLSYSPLKYYDYELRCESILRAPAMAMMMMMCHFLRDGKWLLTRSQLRRTKERDATRHSMLFICKFFAFAWNLAWPRSKRTPPHYTTDTNTCAFSSCCPQVASRTDGCNWSEEATLQHKVKKWFALEKSIT